VPTANFDVDLRGRNEANEKSRNEPNQEDRFYTRMNHKMRLLFDWRTSLLSREIGNDLMSIIEDGSLSDAEDEDFRRLVQQLGKSDPYLRLERPVQDAQLCKSSADFSLAIHTDLLKTKILDSSLLIRPDHLALWNYVLKKYERCDSEVTQSMDSVRKFFEHSFIYPRNLAVEQVLEFRRDKANIYFRKWLSDSIARIRQSGEVQMLDHVLERDFSQLSASFEKRIDNATNLLSATLTGLGSALAGLTGIIPAAVVACILPWLTLKTGEPLVKMYHKRFVKDNWPLFFVEWKKTEEDRR
jgi:hypothetical protein